MFVQRTPGVLWPICLRKIEFELNKVSKRIIKIVGKGGKTLEDILCKKYLLGEATCDRNDCLICTFSESKGKCNVTSVIYTDTCVTCETQGLKSQYWGETNSSAYLRSKRHLEDPKSKSSRSHIYHHLQQTNPELLNNKERENLFRFQVVQKHISAFSRQLSECIQMKKASV